jgi:NAD(P)-dependent dehydrogenase (short-subunit alcohol dehydrogenase family)
MLLKFHGSLRMAQRVTPLMTDQGWGRIVNVASGAGTSPTADNLPTSLVNITVHNLTRTLSDELAPSGVKVNLVAPGLTLTDRAVTLFAGVAREQGRDPMNLSAKASASLPAGRAALPRRWPAWWRSWHPKYAATCSHLRSTWTVAHAARPLDDLRRRTPCSTTS